MKPIKKLVSLEVVVSNIAQNQLYPTYHVYGAAKEYKARYLKDPSIPSYDIEISWDPLTGKMSDELDYRFPNFSGPIYCGYLYLALSLAAQTLSSALDYNLELPHLFMEDEGKGYIAPVKNIDEAKSLLFEILVHVRTRYDWNQDLFGQIYFEKKEIIAFLVRNDIMHSFQELTLDVEPLKEKLKTQVEKEGFKNKGGRNRILVHVAAARYGIPLSDIFLAAEKGQSDLEVLAYVDHKDIVGGVGVADESNEPGYYLALPGYCMARIIEKGDAYIDTFLLPQTYNEGRAGLVILQQVLAQTKCQDLRTKRAYYFNVDQDNLWVSAQQAERLFKKGAEKTSITTTRLPC